MGDFFEKPFKSKYKSADLVTDIGSWKCGKISSVQITDNNDIQFKIGNKNFWKEWIFSDEEFLRNSILPMEILRLVCCGYTGIEEDEGSILITRPKKGGVSPKYRWICKGFHIIFDVNKC